MYMYMYMEPEGDSFIIYIDMFFKTFYLLQM